MNDTTLEQKSDFIRKEVVRIALKNGAGHIAPSLSTVDFLVALYYQCLNLPSPHDPQWPQRDRLIFSKAHGCYALYAILADLNLIPKESWENFYQGSFLAGCVERLEACGLEASCGSLGHGLPIAVGMAFGAQKQQQNYRIYCIVGDGEMQEGSNWEALQFAKKHRLNNLKIIIDNNGLQAMDFLTNVLSEKDCTQELVTKMLAFGCDVQQLDGHNLSQLVTCLEHFNQNEKKFSGPQCLVARTIKGYGLHCMENIPKFHFRLPTSEELEMGKRYV